MPPLEISSTRSFNTNLDKLYMPVLVRGANRQKNIHTDIDMSHSTPEQPTFGEHDESDALPSDAIAAAELDDLRDRRVYDARLGCVLHILHIAVTAGMTSTFFMDPLGKGPWNEWEIDHVFSLRGLVWYNTSRSDSCNANFERWKRKVALTRSGT